MKKFDNRKNKNDLRQEMREEGVVLETLPSLKFKVKLNDDREILAHLAGRLRLYRIKILAGDKVTVEMSPYDDHKGRIVYRGK
jgi:translation initiation factor IF-1